MKSKITVTCDHCKQETTVGFDEWVNLNRFMLSFAALTKEQQEIILLMIDGALYRQSKKVVRE